LFCGKHDLDSLICPNCSVDLLHIATLDTNADSLLTARALPLRRLVLLFCWHCPVARMFQYRAAEDGVTILAFEGGNPERDFPYADYPVYFPGIRFSLVPVIEPTLTELGDWNERTGTVEVPRHEFGGQPRTWQPISAPICMLCNHPMDYLANFGDTNTDSRGFTNNIGAMMLFFMCRTCSVIHATHQVD